ncbi:hypothetical protein OZX73_05665 [Bifidobacterium sp. ESL0775]|uniref:hypothetical protein n=1 Tax=Bifidobacterium sp. ESL0775 TaxID=2983230 RepID=UPI0023F7A468|nr:hypothetical protein [Bifidobacterium sp. ESL0775]WEV68776.1 hypothetical protein OZX73_05665 [Bifidobacterium sp. ESL0775]
MLRPGVGIGVVGLAVGRAIGHQKIVLHHVLVRDGFVKRAKRRDAGSFGNGRRTMKWYRTDDVTCTM